MKCLKIQTKNINISIGSREISIQDRYTIIKGKFKRNLVKKLKPDVFFEKIEDFNMIPFEKFIEFYLNRLQEYSYIEKALKLLNLLNEFHSLMTNNIKILSHYREILNAFSLIINFNLLLKEKEHLFKELEITKEYEKSSDIAAISDLLEKLYKSIDANKKKLKYLEEDYFLRKNQINRINNTIKNYKRQIQNLMKTKKEFFSEINRITREMSGTPEKKEDKSILIPEIDNNLTNSQKIRVLQKKAKEIQNNINDIKRKIEEINLKFKELNPVYEIYKQDYEKLRKIINNDKKRVTELELELKEKILKQKDVSDYKFNEVDLKSFRAKEKVMDDINKINDELSTISIPESLIDLKNPRDLSKIIENLNEINSFMNENQSEIRISKDTEKMDQIIESFIKFETLIHELESLINKFLSLISLKSSFRILLSEDHENFFIKIGFTRNKKEKIRFDELTTPEKVFFIIISFISVELQVGNQNIIFCNLFVPNIYNKAGSIFRTIRKIVPLFETEEKFSSYKLIFILSNLEMKKEVKNVNIITIQENG